MRQRVYRSYNKEETTSRLFYRRRQNLVPRSHCAFHVPPAAALHYTVEASAPSVLASEIARASFLCRP